MRISNRNIGDITYQFEDCFWNLLQDDLGFDRKTLIFQLWSLANMIGGKYVPPQGDMVNVFLFPNMWKKPLQI